MNIMTNVLAVVGALYTLCTTLGAVLPAGKISSIFKTVGADLGKLLGK